MPNDNVFTHSHDEAIGMIGNTLDFIAGESAKARETQRTREFQQGEYQKERDFRSGEEKKKHARDVTSQVSLDYIKNLRSIGTSEALKLADQKSQELAKDPEALNFAMTGGLNDLGLDVSALGKQYPGVEPFMPPGTKRITMDQWQKEIQPLYQHHQDVLNAKNDQEKADKLKMYMQYWGQLGAAKMNRANLISQAGLPTGEIDAAGHPIYDPQYAPHADQYMAETDKILNEGYRALLGGQVPSDETIRAFGEQGNPDTAIRASKERSRAQYNAGQVKSLEEFSVGVRAKVKPIIEEEAKLQKEIVPITKEIRSKHGLPWPGQDKLIDREHEIKKRLKVLKERRERYEQSASEHEAAAKSRKAYASPVTDPLDLLGK